MAGVSDEHSETALRRERLILLILAAVQFTTIVDFMIVMPLGPQLMRTLRIGPAEFGLIVSSYTFAAGLSGLVDRRPLRTANFVLDPLRRVSAGNIALRDLAHVPHTGRRSNRHGCFRGNPGWNGNDHRW